MISYIIILISAQLLEKMRTSLMFYIILGVIFYIKSLSNFLGVFENYKAASSQEVKDYVKILREKLINKTSGVMDEYLLASKFKEYDPEKSGLLHMVQLQAIAMQLNIEIPDNVVISLFDGLSSCRGDFVEFKQLNDFLLYHTYK